MNHQCDKLIDFFTRNPRIAIALSGGVDSAYLLYAAKEAGCAVHAYFVHSAFQPAFEREDAARLAAELDVPLTVIGLDILADSDVVQNGVDRCYFCKRRIFTQIIEAARRDGFPIVADGTNASDDITDRPGMRVLAELGVYSPLRESGMTKADIREASRQAGLFTHQKPAYACLATRIPTDTSICAEDLHRVEAAENELFALGFTDFRVRLWAKSTAKLEIAAGQFEKIMKTREAVYACLAPYFDRVLLDLKPREG